MQPTSDVQSRLTSNNQGLVIDVVGYFTVACLDKFRSCFEAHPPMQRYAVNLQQCQGIDSSGLGMLLMLRDYAKIEQKNLLITHCPPPVHNVLNYAKFDQLFTILN